MVRLGFIIGLLAIIGTLLAGLAAFRVYDQEMAIDRIALARAIDVHASLVQDRLTERELLGRVASGLFRTPTVVKADMLEPLRSSIYAFKTDFVVAGWIARLRPDEIDAAQQVLSKAGFPDPTIRNFDNRPLAVRPARSVARRADGYRAAQRQDHPLARAQPDRSSGAGTDAGPCAERRQAGGVGSDPLQHQGGTIGVVLAAPVLQEAGAVPVGFVTFSYELGSLMLANDDNALYAVALRDPRSADGELVADDNGVVSVRTAPALATPSVLRTERFGGRDWMLAYYPKSKSFARAQQIAAMVAAIGARSR